MSDIGVKFKFKMGPGYSQHSQRLIYTASKRDDDRWQIDWEGGGLGTDYSNTSVISNIEHGDWVVLEVIRPSPIGRIKALQLKGVSILFDKDMTVNIRGMRGDTQLGILGLCRTQEELEMALTRAEKEFGITT